VEGHFGDGCELDLLAGQSRLAGIDKKRERGSGTGVLLYVRMCGGLQPEDRVVPLGCVLSDACVD
jgi:hypothetical protein